MDEDVVISVYDLPHEIFLTKVGDVCFERIPYVLKSDYATLQAEVAILAKALRYYANEDIYHAHGEPFSEAWHDEGETARKALDEVSGVWTNN